MRRPTLQEAINWLRECGFTVALVQDGKRKYRVTKEGEIHLFGIKDLRNFSIVQSSAPGSPAFNKITQIY